MQKLLLADSGGTRTDWCLITEGGQKQFFSGVSYHPAQWNEDFIKEQTQFWLANPEKTEAKLIFYGAGCMNPLVANRIKETFLSWGFLSVEVHSDVHAAGVAAFGNEHGFVAIMGTGSVFAEMNNKEIIQLRGGLGYLLGDEGSGYYFGKLLIQKYLNNAFDAPLTEQLALLLGNRSEVINKVYQAQGKQFLASIAEIIATIDHPSINSVHEENIRLFLDPFLTLDAVTMKGISFCGSYAWGRQAQVIKILEECNINRFKFVKEPIVELAEYTVKSTV
jgi:N-acetylglucosamine kinase-like BadF-type ATPase